MTPRMILPILALLSQTGCVAAIPLAMQLMSGTNSGSPLCSMAKLPGQTTSLCDRIPSSLASQAPVAPAVQTAQTPHRAANGTIVTTAER